MEILIKNKKDRSNLVETLELDPTSTMQEIVREVLKNSKDTGDEACTIRINHFLVAPSYISNAPVFARQLGTKNYPYVCSISEEEELVIYGTQEKQATTFRGRVISSLQSTREFISPTKEVPITYRLNPKPFTQMLEAVLEKPVRFTRSKKKKQFIWKTNKK